MIPLSLTRRGVRGEVKFYKQKRRREAGFLLSGKKAIKLFSSLLLSFSLLPFYLIPKLNFNLKNLMGEIIFKRACSSKILFEKIFSERSTLV